MILSQLDYLQVFTILEFCTDYGKSHPVHVSMSTHTGREKYIPASPMGLPTCALTLAFISGLGITLHTSGRYFFNSSFKKTISILLNIRKYTYYFNSLQRSQVPALEGGERRGCVHMVVEFTTTYICNQCISRLTL